MTIQTPSAKTVLIVLTIGVLFFILGRGCKCNGNAAPELTVQQIKDSAKVIIDAKDKDLRKYKDSMRFKNEQIAYSNSVTEEAVTMSNQASDDASNMRDKLSATQKELAKYKAEKDTLKTLSACDSLNNQVTELENKSIRAVVACKTAIEGLRDVSARKDEALAIQGREISKMKSSLDLLGNTLQLVSSQKDPAIKGYLGAAVGLGGTGMLSNFGPELTFITRGGYLFGVGGKFGNGGLTGEFRAGKQISFKKK